MYGGSNPGGCLRSLKCPRAGAALLVGRMDSDTEGCGAAVVLELVTTHWRVWLRPQ